MFNYAIIVILLMIALEDFRHRQVHVLWFILLIVAILLESFGVTGQTEHLNHFLTNLLFIIVQWLGITLFFTLKTKKLVNVMDRYIGWGDAVLLFAFALLLPPLSFALFMILSYVLVLIISLIRLSLNRSKPYPVPLAGWLGIFMMVLISLDQASILSLSYSDFLLYDQFSQWMLI